MATHLHPVDLAIVALYLIGITLFGLRFAKRGGKKADRSLKSYFLADNTIPWWAIALSIVSAETSTLTIISIPGVAFAGDFGFLQIVLGYMLGRIVVAALFLPRYFSGNMLTAYQLIDQRFGPTLHKVTAGLFLLTRAAAEGVRIFAVSIVVGIAIGTGDILSIGIISALTLLYTFEGGMAAVIWTDVIQMFIYVGGTFIAVWSLGHHVPGGWTTIHTVASAAGKFHMFNFALNLTTTYTFWAGILGGTFLTMASHGTDQLMVQRMLAARSLRESRLALLSSGVVIFMQFALFLLIGVGLWVFYRAGAPAPPIPEWHSPLQYLPFTQQIHDALAPAPLPSVAGLSPDRIFPTFIVHELPIGIAGLLVAAILAAAMSNLSAALNSLSSTTVVDFYMAFRPQAAASNPSADRERNLISKSSTGLWAIALFAIAIYSLSVGGKGHVVEIGLSIASVAYGCLLGVFLLGTLTKFATEIGTAIGMICGFALNLWLWQGTFPKYWVFGNVGTSRCQSSADAACYAHTLTIPHIAFTWYVLIGALVTFAIGALASLIFRKQSRRTATTIAALLLFCLSFPKGICVSQAQAQAQTIIAGIIRYPDPLGSGLIASLKDEGLQPPGYAFSQTATTPDFTPITTLLNDAIAAHKLPGAVVLIGHNNQVVFHHAYGNRKLANEPGLDGQPSPAEPMTEDTIFDMASLTKDLATATAVMQLYEAGKITSFDDPVEKYLPAFNTTHDPQRSKVTLRMLLTHTSGEAPDISLKDPWGLATPDRTEGLHRALTSPLKDTPGSLFTYSDINFILLGDLIETLSGQREDDYARDHIFKPLGMTDTRYLPMDQRCGVIGVATWGKGKHAGGEAIVDPCRPNGWEQQQWLPRIAPTAHDDESKADPKLNPDFDHLLRGTVHDPTTRRMGGVAGHAGVFSTAHDISLYAGALLEKLVHNTGPFPLKQSTLQLMTQPEQPGHTTNQLAAAQAANNAAIAAGDKPAEPGLAPHYPAIKGENLRGFGWDIDTAFSKPRGAIFPIGSFGHTGFTGTSLWMDPASDTYVILLANAIHPRGNPPISNLRGEVATAAAQALGLTTACTTTNLCHPERSAAQPKDPDTLNSPATAQNLSATNLFFLAAALPSRPERSARKKPAGADGESACSPDPNESCDPVSPFPGNLALTPSTITNTLTEPTLTGIDVLELTHFAALANLRHLGLLTNQTGLDKDGHRTIDVLITNHQPLTTLFTPEHGLSATQDTEHLTAETDPATHLPIISLYGLKPADRHPTHAQLKDLDAVIIDLQDAGVHFWTYEAAAAYFLEAAAREESDFHHQMEVIVLDRPNPVGGLAVQGPVSDPGRESYTNYMPLPVRHGLTLGELLRYVKNTHGQMHFSKACIPAPQKYDANGKPLPLECVSSLFVKDLLNVHLTVIPMQNWHRDQFYASTGLPWVNPSPNLRSPEAALRYPALGLIETTNISVGRGSVSPFSFFGAGVPAGAKPSSIGKTTVETAITPPSTSSNGYTAQLGGSGAHQTTTPNHTYTAGTRITHDTQTSSPTGWFNAEKVADALNARSIPGASFAATKVPIAEDSNHYPFHGQTIPAVKLTLTDPALADTPEIGIEILAVLHRLYPTQFNLDRVMALMDNQATLDALKRGDDPRSIAASWQPSLEAFRRATQPYRLYP